MRHKLGHLMPNFVNLIIIDRAFLLGRHMSASNHLELHLLFGCECHILLGYGVTVINLDVTIFHH